MGFRHEGLEVGAWLDDRILELKFWGFFSDLTSSAGLGFEEGFKLTVLYGLAGNDFCFSNWTVW